MWLNYMLSCWILPNDALRTETLLMAMSDKLSIIDTFNAVSEPNQVICDHISWEVGALNGTQAVFSSFTWYFCGPTAAIHIPMLTSSPCNNTHDRLLTLFSWLSGHYFPTVAQCLVRHLVGLQLLCVAGEPLDQVARDHITWATGKRRIGWAGVFQLLPLPNAIHCPALPETRSGSRGIIIASSPSFTWHFIVLTVFHLKFSRQRNKVTNKSVKNQGEQSKISIVYMIQHHIVLTFPTRNCCAWDPCGQSSVIPSPRQYNNHHLSSAADQNQRFPQTCQVREFATLFKAHLWFFSVS